LTDLVATGSFPIAHGPGNTVITGPAYEYIVTGGASFALAYPAATANQGAPDAVLTHRVHLDDPAVVVPPTGWAYTDGARTAIKLTSGNFVNNDIYEFSYIARDPTVMAWDWRRSAISIHSCALRRTTKPVRQIRSRVASTASTPKPPRSRAGR